MRASRDALEGSGTSLSAAFFSDMTELLWLGAESSASAVLLAKDRSVSVGLALGEAGSA